MQKVIIVTGVLLGMLLGAAVLLFNPVALMRPALADLASPGRVLSSSGGTSSAGFALSPRGLLGMDSGPAPAAAFNDPAIRHARADVLVLTGADGAVQSLGVRLSALGRSNSLLQARLGVVTGWNVVWPGEGSLLLSGSENLWPPWRDGLWSAVRGRGFRPQDSYLLQPLPDSGPPFVVAGTGTLAGAAGVFRERLFPADKRPGDFYGRREMQVALDRSGD